MPGCEQPTRTTSPSGVRSISDSSCSSRVPGVRETVDTIATPGATSVSESSRMKWARGHTVELMISAGSSPPK